MLVASTCIRHAVAAALLPPCCTHLVAVLLILAQAETLEHILEWRGVQVLLQVMEGVLGDVSHAQVGVAPHSAAGGLVLTSDDLDQRLATPATGGSEACTVSASRYKTWTYCCHALLMSLLCKPHALWPTTLCLHRLPA